MCSFVCPCVKESSGFLFGKRVRDCSCIQHCGMQLEDVCVVLAWSHLSHSVPLVCVSLLLPSSCVTLPAPAIQAL